MFEYDLSLLVNLYLDTSNFFAGCYIISMRNLQTRLLIYNSFLLLPAKQNNKTYRRKLDTIAEFSKKYFYKLNIAHLSVLNLDHNLYCIS